MTNPFSLAGRSYAPPSPNLFLPHVARTLYAPCLLLADGATSRIVLSNHLPVRNTVRIRLFNSEGKPILVRWSGPEPQHELILRLDPFVTRFVEVDGADCAESFLAWARIDMAALGTTGYASTIAPGQPGNTFYGELASDADVCVRQPFDCESGKVSHYTLINTGGEPGEEREFVLQFFRANNAGIEHVVRSVRSGCAISVVPDVTRIQNQSGILEVRGLDDHAGFLLTGFWFHPDGRRGILPILPSTGSRV